MRMEMAVCSHLNHTWNLRPKGSGPASNWRKLSIYGYLISRGKNAHCRIDRAARVPAWSADVDEPGPGEVQVRVRAVGICGSDLHSYAEGGVGDAPCVYPMVLGHGNQPARW